MGKKLIIVFALSFFINNIFAQGLLPSNVEFEGMLGTKTVFATSGVCFVQVNEQTSQIAGRMNVSSLDADDDMLDSIFSKLEDYYVTFKGDFPLKKLSFSDGTNDSQRDYNGACFVTINGITKSIPYTMMLINIGDAPNNGVYQARLNLELEINPVDFKLNELLPGLTNKITMEIGKGYINKINVGGENLFNRN